MYCKYDRIEDIKDNSIGFNSTNCIVNFNIEKTIFNEQYVLIAQIVL